MGAIISTIIIVVFLGLATLLGEHTGIGQKIIEIGVRWMED